MFTQHSTASHTKHAGMPCCRQTAGMPPLSTDGCSHILLSCMTETAATSCSSKTPREHVRAVASSLSWLAHAPAQVKCWPSHRLHHSHFTRQRKTCMTTHSPISHPPALDSLYETHQLTLRAIPVIWRLPCVACTHMTVPGLPMQLPSPPIRPVPCYTPLLDIPAVPVHHLPAPEHTMHPRP